MTYRLNEYGQMIADRVRMDPYAYALKAAIGPDSVVLDIGAGTGIHALLACKFGARHVYAIEPNEAIHLARELAQANGFGDRITFIHDFSTQVTLPERADVIVSDLRGVLPLFGAHIPAVVDARQRHLAPGGRLIPKRDNLWVALVEAGSVYKELLKPWDHPYGLAMEEARQIVLNSWTADHTQEFRPGNLLMAPHQWAVLDYESIVDPDVTGMNSMHWATRSGTAHGLLIWFDAELFEGFGFSNGPQEKRTAEVYGQGFFPLLAPVALEEGDSIDLTVRAELVQGEYIWRWFTRIQGQDEAAVVKADFKQSTAGDTPLSRNRLAEQAKNSRPALSEEGQIDLFIMGKMDGQATMAEIARDTFSQFPTRFKDQGEALIHVYGVAQQDKEG
jgi:protein arginine N-methyltransferase 1